MRAWIRELSGPKSHNPNPEHLDQEPRHGSVETVYDYSRLDLPGALETAETSEAPSGSPNEACGASTWNAGAARTVLVIASRFPPVASVGAVRVRKLVKYIVCL